MRSLGFYYKLKDEVVCPSTNRPCKEISLIQQKESASDKEEVEIHCNLWKVQRVATKLRKFLNPKYDFLLDIGILFDTKIKTLALYFPFELSNENITDLGQTIIQDQELCCLVFNEDVTTAHVNNGCFSVVGFKNRERALWIYPIAETNYNCEKSKESLKGTILNIKIHSDPQTIDANLWKQYVKNYTYIRFRIKLSAIDLKNFKREENLSKDIIQSIFSRLEMFDFRINDKREINKKIDEDLRSKGYATFRMSKVHFFLMCDTRNNVDKASMRCQSRFLETDKWGAYLNQPIPQSMIAYHWKDQTEKELFIEKDGEISFRDKIKLTDLLRWERRSFSNFRLFFMLTYPQRSILQISFYCLLAIALGAVGSMVATMCIPSPILISPFGGFLVMISVILLAILLWIRLKNHSAVKFIP